MKGTFAANASLQCQLVKAYNNYSCIIALLAQGKHMSVALVAWANVALSHPPIIIRPQGNE